MIIADYLLAWTAVAAAIAFAAHLFRLPAQQRYAQGVYVVTRPERHPPAR